MYGLSEYNHRPRKTESMLEVSECCYLLELKIYVGGSGKFECMQKHHLTQYICPYQGTSDIFSVLVTSCVLAN